MFRPKGAQVRTAPNRWLRCTAQPATADPDARQYEVSLVGFVALLRGDDDHPGELSGDSPGGYDDWQDAERLCRPWPGDRRGE